MGIAFTDIEPGDQAILELWMSDFRVKWSVGNAFWTAAQLKLEFEQLGTRIEETDRVIQKRAKENEDCQRFGSAVAEQTELPPTTAKIHWISECVRFSTEAFLTNDHYQRMDHPLPIRIQEKTFGHY
jgi:hypothetical protein